MDMQVWRPRLMSGQWFSHLPVSLQDSLLSAAKLRRAQMRVTAARPYAAKLSEIMENLAGLASGLAHPLFEARPEKTIGLVIVTASKGLCGSYNSALLR